MLPTIADTDGTSWHSTTRMVPRTCEIRRLLFMATPFYAVQAFQKTNHRLTV